jgi:hypothetical protein
MQWAARFAAMLRAMNAPRRITLIITTAVAAFALMAVPALADADSGASAVLAVEDAPVDEQEPAANDDDHRIGLVDTPRDRFGLLLLGVLVIGGGAAVINARRQLKGEREQATGEFRWR